MAQRFFKTGATTWNTANNWSATSAGGVDNAGVPTAADDVIFELLSGSCQINVNAVCRSLDCTSGVGSYTGALTYSTTAITLSIGTTTAGAGNVALKLSSGMTYTAATTNTLSFISTSGTQQTITTAGKTMPNIAFGGAGGSWIHTDTVTCGTYSQTSANILNTGNQTINCTSFASNTASSRTLTLGSSAINCSLAAVGALNIRFSNLTMTSNTATITFTGSSGGMTLTTIGGNFNGTSLVWTGSSAHGISGTGLSFTVANLTITGTANKTDSMITGADITVTGDLNISGNSSVNVFSFASNIRGITRTVTVGGTVTLSNVDFCDITAAGATGTWSGTRLGDMGHNSNITFAPGVNKYAVVAGNASSTATWSTTSGGTGGTSLPLPQDNIFFDGNSAAGTYVLDMPRAGNNINCTGFTRTINLNNTEMYGSWISSTNVGMAFASTSGITFAGQGNNTITSNGKQWSGSLLIDCGVGTYTLADAFTTSRAAASSIASGRFNDGGFNVSFIATTGNAFTLTGGTVDLSGTWSWNIQSASTFWNNSAGTVNASSADFVLNATATVTRTFAGGGGTYGNLIYTVAASTGQLTITGSNSLNDLQASDGRTIVFTSGTNTTLRATHALQLLNGISGSLTSVKSSVAATPATLTFPNGYGGASDYLSVQDITATTNTWYAGANSTNVSGNTNVTFSAPPALSTTKNLALLGVG